MAAPSLVKCGWLHKRTSDGVPIYRFSFNESELSLLDNKKWEIYITREDGRPCIVFVPAK